MSRDRKELDVKSLTEIDLVNIVNETEGFSWRINHDAADGRIPNEGVNESLSELRSMRDRAVDEIKQRTGYSTHDQLKVYITEKLKQQNEMWDQEWEELSKTRSVFTFKETTQEQTTPIIFETVRAYLPLRGTFGPNQYILSRIQGEFGTGKFVLLDDRKIPELKKIDRPPIYVSESNKSIVTVDEETEKRIELPFKKSWREINVSGQLFSHAGFNEVFETYAAFNLPGVSREESNEVILARPYSSEARFYEFGRKELGLMTPLPFEPRFHKKRDNSWFHSVDLYLDDKI